MTHPDTTPKDDQQPPAQDRLQLIDAWKESCISTDNENKKREAEQQAVIDDMRSTLRATEDQLQSRTAKVGELESQLKEVKQELQEKGGKLVAAEEKCNALGTKLKTKEIELTEENVWGETYCKAWMDANKHLTTVRSELKKKVGRHEAVKETLNTTRSQRDEANTRLKRAVEELAQAKTEGDAVKAELKIKNEEHEAIKETLIATKEQLDSTNTQLTSAVEELAQVKTKGDKARADAEEWKGKLERAKAAWGTRTGADCELHTIFATKFE